MLIETVPAPMILYLYDKVMIHSIEREWSRNGVFLIEYFSQFVYLT